MMTKRKKMIAHNSNEGSRHIGVVWFIWYAADSAHALGQLAAIDYSDSTPDVAFTYDRLGRQLTVTDVLGTRTNVYFPTDLLEERHPDGSVSSAPNGQKRDRLLAWGRISEIRASRSVSLLPLCTSCQGFKRMDAENVCLLGG